MKIFMKVSNQNTSLIFEILQAIFLKFGDKEKMWKRMVDGNAVDIGRWTAFLAENFEIQEKAGRKKTSRIEIRYLCGYNQNEIPSLWLEINRSRSKTLQLLQY
jgi:hypothetical protein